MKKYLLLLLCIAFVGYVSFINARNSISNSPMITEGDSIIVTPKLYRISGPKADSIKKWRIHYLLSAGLNDSVIAYCNQLKNKDAIYMDLYNLSIASAYHAKGQKQEAYDLVMKDINYYLALNAGSNNPLQMLCNYQIGFPLTEDKLLEDMALNTVNDYYSKINYPESSTGIKLIKLRYQWSNLSNFIDNELASMQTKGNATADDAIQKDAVIQASQLLKATVINEFKALIDRNQQKLFSEYQIGTVSKDQLFLINSFVDADSTNYWNEIMKNSLDAKVISTDEYISYLLANFRLSSNAVALIQYNDSLCAKYGCNTSVLYNVNDSTILQINYKAFDRTVDTLHIVSKNEEE